MNRLIRKGFVMAALRGLGVFGALAFGAREAAAHGGFPRAFEIVVEPGNPDDVLLRSDLWGFFRSTDGGKSWQWTCAEAYGSASLSVNHLNFALAPGGRALVAAGFKGLRATDDMCTWNTTADLDGEFVKDVTVAGDGVFALTATNSSDGSAVTKIWKSTDKGTHFTKESDLTPADFAGGVLRYAGSDLQTVYVLGRILEATPGTLNHSDDGGKTWKTTTIDIKNQLMELRIAGVHPTRPDVLFVWGDLEEDYGKDEPDEIWGSDDAGVTWKQIYVGTGDLPGLAFSPDGTELMIAGPREGVQLAKLDDVFTKGQAAFSQQFAGQVWGLHWTSTGLSAGTDNFTAEGIPALTYGESSDDGKSFDSLLSICDVKYDACAAGTTVRTTCNRIYDDPAGGFLQDYTQGPRCVEEPAADAGVPKPKPANGSSSGCAVGTTEPVDHGNTGAGFVGLLSCVAGVRLLRRARR